MEKVTKFFEGKDGALLEGEINEMLVYEFADDNELWLHVMNVQDKSIGEKLRLLREGFSVLAERFKDWGGMWPHIKIISGTSWMITEHPRLFEKLGFTIDNEAPGFERAKKVYGSKNREKGPVSKWLIKPSYAYMTKEKFIELYYDQDYINKELDSAVS